MVSLGLSDHDGIWVSIPCNYNQVQHYTCRMLNEQNIANLKGRLNSINWYYMLSTELDAIKNCKTFMDILAKEFSECYSKLVKKIKKPLNSTSI